METTHYVYILKCGDAKYYHGYTKDLKKPLTGMSRGEPLEGALTGRNPRAIMVAINVAT